jgi:hypothetical protein
LGAHIEAAGEVDQQYDRERGATGDDRAEGGQASRAAAPQDQDQSQGDDDRADRDQYVCMRVAGGLQVDGRRRRRLDSIEEFDLFPDLHPVVIHELGDDEEGARRGDGQADRPPRGQHRGDRRRRPGRAQAERSQRGLDQRQRQE